MAQEQRQSTEPQTAPRRPGTEAPITVTPKAVEMGKKKLAEGGEQVLGIRIGVRGGGCSGYSYVFDFAEKLKKRDMLFDFDGLPVVVDNRSLEFLRGAELDWEEELLGYGFKWKNPNAKGGCGCGESFNV